MKSRSTELLDRAILAMAAAIELYNKPGFRYRNESFSILALNAWELVIKSKWLVMHGNKTRSLYVYEHRQTKKGKSKRKYIKRTKSDTPLTYDVRYLSRQLVARSLLDQRVLTNIEAILEFRNNATHFYNQSPSFEARLYELSAACVRNFVNVVEDWFGRSVNEFGIHLIPLTFLDPPSFKGVVLRSEEKQFLAFLDGLDYGAIDPTSPYSVAVSVDLKFTKSRTESAVHVNRSRDVSAISLTLSEEDIRERYPWDYATLTKKCRQRYTDFVINQEYHRRRKKLETDQRFGHVRHLDPGNPNSGKKVFFNPNILSEFDKRYSRRR